MSEPQGQIGLRVFKKPCLNLCSLKWIRPTRGLVKEVVPLLLLALCKLLPKGLLKDNKRFSGTSKGVGDADIQFIPFDYLT